MLITPRLVRPLNPDEVPTLPTSIRPFIKKGDMVSSSKAAGEWSMLQQTRRQRSRTSRTAGNSHDWMTIDQGLTRNERGAVLIQVAVALLALLALSSFVFDYGVMSVSRGQAQNSADAGALSGAISLAFDSSTDQNAARAKAIALAQRNRVWTQQPDITNADVTFPPCPPGAPGSLIPASRWTCSGISARAAARYPCSSAASSVSRTRVSVPPRTFRLSPETRPTASSPGPSSIAGIVEHRHQWCGVRYRIRS